MLLSLLLYNILVWYLAVLQLKLTLPLRREKANADCGELQIELDDLHISMNEIVRLDDSSPETRTHHVLKGMNNSTSNNQPSTSNHVTSTGVPSTRSLNPATANGVGADGNIQLEMDSLTLDTTDSARWTPSNAGGSLHTQQQRQPSPVTLRGNATEVPGVSAAGSSSNLLGVSTPGGSANTGSGTTTSKTSLLPPIPGYVSLPPTSISPSSTSPMPSTLPRPHQATTASKFWGISNLSCVSILYQYHVCPSKSMWS